MSNSWLFKLDFAIRSYFAKKVFAAIKKEVEGYETLADLGCGSNEYMKDVTRQVRRSIGVDLFAPSIQKSRDGQIYSEFVQMDIIEYLEKLPARSIDAVVAISVIEHYDKEKGMRLMHEMERVAKRKVIIFTPNGFVPQQPYEGNPWQEHKSGWSHDEMRSYGYKVFGFTGHKSLRGERAIIKYRPRLFWKIVSYISQIFVHKNARGAFEILCIKDVSVKS